VEPASGDGRALEALVTGLVAVFGFLLGGPIGAFVGAAGSGYAVDFAKKVQAEWTRKSTIVVQAAIEVAGQDPAIFSALADNPRLTALGQRIAFAAYMSGSDKKLRALGRLLGGAIAARGDKLDEAELLASVFADIGDAEILALELIAGDPPNADDQRRNHQQAGTPFEGPFWSVEAVQERLPIEPGLAQACLSALARYGLAEALSAYGPRAPYRITAFGRDFLAVMNAAAQPRTE
jgi:hypothetical protein